MNPMDTDTYTRIGGLIVVLSILAFAWEFAKNRGASFISDTLGSLTGGLLSADGSGDGNDMWDGV